MGGRKTNGYRSEAKAPLDSDGTRQKPLSPVGLTHLDRELSGQNGPDGVTQAGEEAAGNAQH